MSHLNRAVGEVNNSSPDRPLVLSLASEVTRKDELSKGHGVRKAKVIRQVARKKRKQQEYVTLSSDDDEDKVPVARGPETGEGLATGLYFEEKEAVLCFEGMNNVKVPITPEDIRCLNYLQFVNDAVIAFWIAVIQREILSAEDLQRTFFYDTFFYGTLKQPLKRARTAEEAQMTVGERRHARVRKRTKDVDIFEKDFLIVPINVRNRHWLLAIICFPGREGYCDFETLEPLPHYGSAIKSGKKRKRSGKLAPGTGPVKRPVKHPCILVFNSLAGRERDGIYSTLREYLSVEYKTRKNGVRKFDEKSMPGFTPNVPQQPNLSDCGLFMLHYIESFFSNPIKSFDNSLMNLKHWFPSAEAVNKRKVMYDFIRRKTEERYPQNVARIPQVSFGPKLRRSEN